MPTQHITEKKGEQLLTKHFVQSSPRVLCARIVVVFALISCLTLVSCATESSDTADKSADNTNAQNDTMLEISDKLYTPDDSAQQQEATREDSSSADQANTSSAEELRLTLNLTEDYRSSFDHGDKSAAYQKYIMLHDTEGDSSPQSIVDWWDSNGNLVAAHFIVGKDGSIMQCVPLDRIAHHAGYGDAGHNASFGVEDESRDDKLGTTSIGSWAPDYGMNSYSVGIEMVHVGGGSDDYPEAQLEALDALIAYIDAYYGFESEIVDHKAWRTGNSDTSSEFATYLANYQSTRTHDGA